MIESVLFGTFFLATLTRCAVRPAHLVKPLHPHQCLCCTPRRQAVLNRALIGSKHTSSNFMRLCPFAQVNVFGMPHQSLLVFWASILHADLSAVLQAQHLSSWMHWWSSDFHSRSCFQHLPFPGFSPGVFPPITSLLTPKNTQHMSSRLRVSFRLCWPTSHLYLCWRHARSMDLNPFLRKVKV